jgi:uncharacterized protein YqjF (DUF2071 family)
MAPMTHAAPLDRLSPRTRPNGRPAGYQSWQKLLFVHWALPVSTIRPLVPKAFELDTWDGEIFVGAVPFFMQDTRLSFFPKGTGLDFLETNLRTYVHYKGQPGVYFFSLEASSWLAVKAARLGWGLPYHHARMHADVSVEEISYDSKRIADGAHLDARFRIGDALPVAAPDSLEFFLLERYYLFVERNGIVSRGQVHHVPYPAHRAELLRFDQSLVAAAGGPSGLGMPTLAHYSPGVSVEVFGPHVVRIV